MLARTELWSEILRISIEIEGATNFTIDSTAPAGRSGADQLDDESSLLALGVRADDRRRVLKPMSGVEATLATLGPRVLSVDLYADQAWVAGISDWGDEMDVLFGDAAWAELVAVIERFSLGSIVDQAEALSRPVFTH
jgi:hypothetical protein